MQDNHTIEQWLDAYTRGSVSLEEVKTRLSPEAYAAFAAEAEVHKAAVDIVKRYNVMQQVNAVHNAYLAARPPAAQKKVVALYARRIMQVAAVFIIVIASSYLILVNTTTQSQLVSALSSDYYLQTSRANGNGSVSAITQAFNAKEFDRVISTYEAITNPTPRERFLAGYAYLQTGSYGQAANNFKTIINDNQNTSERLYNDEAEYYLVLSYLQLQQYDDAYTLARLINKDKYHTYHQNIDSWLLLKLKLMK